MEQKFRVVLLLFWGVTVGTVLMHYFSSITDAELFRYSLQSFGLTSLSAITKRDSAIFIYEKPLVPVKVDFKENILFTIKTTARNYERRLLQVLLTWCQTVEKHKLVIVSDSPTIRRDTVDLIRMAGFDIYLSKCEVSHAKEALCCKSATEFRIFYNKYRAAFDKTKYQWFCHVDDDVYVNVKELSNVLQRYDPSLPYYIGRWPSEFYGKGEVDDPTALRNMMNWNIHPVKNTYRYSTGSTYCFSYSMMLRGARYFNDSSFPFCTIIGRPEDMSVGATTELILGVNLTNIDTIHGQYEDLYNLSNEELKRLATIAIKISLSSAPIEIDTFLEEDVSKFLAFHCLLYPDVSWCPK